MDTLRQVIAAQPELKADSKKRWYVRKELRPKVEEKRPKIDKESSRVDLIKEFLNTPSSKRKIESNAINPLSNADASSQHKIEDASNNETEDAISDEPSISKTEIFRRLRRLHQPITLFAETDIQRFQRMCRLQLEMNEDEAKGGRQNVLIDVLAGRESAADDGFQELARSTIGYRRKEILEAAESSSTNAVTQNVDAYKEGDSAGIDAVANSLATGVVHETFSKLSPSAKIRCWVKHMLQIWDEELRERPDEEKKTAEGKMATGTHRQTRRDLKPLLRKLKTNGLEEAITDKLSKIVDSCVKRHYRDAHDLYMLLAIGNAAWPMGVTMVGIHERAGRSKIFTSEVAHILNDETTRKYIQMIKRLMSFSQRKYSADPSQMVQISTNNV